MIVAGAQRISSIRMMDDGQIKHIDRELAGG